MTVYCVWAWDQYYPEGGNGNLIGIYTNRDDAVKAVNDEIAMRVCDYVTMTEEVVK